MIIGHQKQWQFLKQSGELGKLSHAYLFSGQEKLGKKLIALEFVKSLFGQDLLNPPHPDFILVEPIGKEIQISQIRDLSWRLSLKSFSAPFKVAIIDQAHLMTKEAQNSFLKTLEEPKGETLLFLITEYPEMLFPTILSRVQKIKFYPVKKVEIENYFKKSGLQPTRHPHTASGLSEKEAKEIARISLGRPGIAIDLATASQRIQPTNRPSRKTITLENQKKIVKGIITLTHSDLASRFQYAKDLSKEPNLREILEIWLNYFRNLLISKCSALLKISSPKANKLDKKANFKQYSFSKLRNILKQIQNTNFLISNTNVNPRLALEILMLEL